jgi:hypothetical protein
MYINQSFTSFHSQNKCNNIAFLLQSNYKINANSILTFSDKTKVVLTVEKSRKIFQYLAKKGK